MISEVKKLTVTYNGRTVGYLAQIDDEGVFGFQYDHAWLKDGFSISPFSLPLRHEVFSAKSKHFEGLHGVFWDSLPDGWGELLVKRYLGGQGINYDRLSPLTKLSLVSQSGLGGLRYEPSQFESSSSQTTGFDRIAEEVNSVLRDESTNLDEVYRLGGSSGGARPKAHISLDGEEWIVKFPCGSIRQTSGKWNTTPTLRPRYAELTLMNSACFHRRSVPGILARNALIEKEEEEFTLSLLPLF